jgi:hypothetical protein
MKSDKPQGPSRAALVGSALLLSAALVGVAYFRHDDPKGVDAAVATSPAASTLQPLFARCTGTPNVEVVDGATRTTCTETGHPSFMVYQDVSDDAIRRAGLMVPMYGRQQQLEERKLLGLELFSLFAGAPAESFLPPEQLAVVGVQETRFTREGWVYVTQPMANVGLVFSVIRASDQVAREN